jgi:hypothetical protein
MDINYPVFRLGTEQPAFDEGVVYYLRQYKLEFGEVEDKLLIVDDTTIPQEALAKRRLHLLKNGVKLKSIDRAVFFLGDLIKIADRKSWFIDNSGKVFQYKKEKVAKLVFKKIKTMHALATGGAIIEVEGFVSRFKCLYTPQENEIYAGVLMHGMINILFGVYTEQHKDTWRMI